MDVSVIIVNYNTKKMTYACIESIRNNTIGVDYEIIVVDNASTDGSKELFKQDCQIILIESNSNLGFGKANNQGFQIASGKYIFFLNSDTLLLNNAIKIFYDFMETNQNRLSIACVGCLLLGNDLLRVHSYANFPKASSYIKDLIVDHIVKRFGKKSVQKIIENRNEDYDYFQVDYVTGADLFVSYDMFKKQQGFDPDFFMYFEETELQYRFNKIGYSNYIIKGPQIIHLEGGSSTKKQSFQKQINVLKSVVLYYRKTLSPLKFILFRIGLFFCYFHLFIFPRISIIRKKELFKILLS